MVEIVPYLSVSMEDIIVCCVLHYVRAANGCCRAKHQETGRLMKNMEGDQCVLSAVHRKTDRRASVRGASICACECEKDTETEKTDQNEEENILFLIIIYEIMFYLS